MKKFFRILFVILIVIIVAIVAFFKSIPYYIASQKHLGRWHVDYGYIQSNAMISEYCVFLDDWITIRMIKDGVTTNIKQYKIKVENDRITLYNQDGSVYKTYNIEYAVADKDKYMFWRSTDERITLKRDTFNMPSVSIGNRMKLNNPYIPYTMTAENGVQFSLQFFANGYYRLDEDIDAFWLHESRDSLTLRHGDYSHMKLLSDKELYWHLENKPYKMRLTPQSIEKSSIQADNHSGKSDTFNVIPKKDYLNGKPSQTNIKTQTQREADLKSQRVEFAKKAILGRIQNNTDEWSGIDLDDYLIYLLSKWKRDAIELYGTGNNIFNDATWHIGYEHWDEQLTFKQEKECSRKLNGENTKMYLLRFDLSYGGKLFGSKEIIIYSTGKMVDGEMSFKVYDICTDEASSGYWVREELKKYYRDELVGEGMYKD